MCKFFILTFLFSFIVYTAIFSLATCIYIVICYVFSQVSLRSLDLVTGQNETVVGLTEGERETWQSSPWLYVLVLPEGWTASIDEELMEGPTSLTEDTEKWKVWQVRA